MKRMSIMDTIILVLCLIVAVPCFMLLCYFYTKFMLLVFLVAGLTLFLVTSEESDV